MTEQLLVTIRSLVALMVEESAAIERGGWPTDIAPLAEAKARLIGALEAASAEAARVNPDWLDRVRGPERKELLEAVDALRKAAAHNAAVVARQIDLSKELLGAIAGEARRLGGTSQQTYRRSGTLKKRDDLAPVAINTRL